MIARAQLVGGLRIVFGVIWFIDAMMKWTPTFFAQYLAMLKAGAHGQPSWLAPWFHLWITMVSPHPYAWAFVTALVETATALGLIFGFAQKIGYLVGTLFSLAIWSTAEGFGGPYTPGVTDIGTSIIYALVFIYLAALQYLEGIPAWSLDRWLTRRWAPWRRVADFAQHAPLPGNDRPTTGTTI